MRVLAEHVQVRFLKPIYLGDLPDKRSWTARKAAFLWAFLWSMPLLRRRINSYLFPALRVLPQMASLVRESQSEVIVSIWSWEALAATYAIRGVPKFAYYGNPDHKPMAARLAFPALFGIPQHRLLEKLHFLAMGIFNKAREIQHLRMMKQCDVTANNSLVDARYYTKSGHPNSLYLQNMWPQAKLEPIFGGKCFTKNK